MKTTLKLALTALFITALPVFAEDAPKKKMKSTKDCGSCCTQGGDCCDKCGTDKCGTCCDKKAEPKKQDSKTTN